MNELQISNAIIESVTLSKGERGLLTAYLFLDYGGSGQGFGGYALYLPKSFVHHDSNNQNYAGHFIFRCLEIAGVDEWEKLKGKCIRVKHEHSKIHAIGHIIKDDWFNPSKDFKNQP